MFFKKQKNIVGYAVERNKLLKSITRIKKSRSNIESRLTDPDTPSNIINELKDIAEDYTVAINAMEILLNEV